MTKVVKGASTDDKPTFKPMQECLETEQEVVRPYIVSSERKKCYLQTQYNTTLDSRFHPILF